MSKKLNQKIKNAFAAMLAVICLAFVLSFFVAPLFPTHSFYIQVISVGMMTLTGGQLVYKILKAV